MGVWDRLADGVKRWLVEIVEANLPAQSTVGEIDESDERGATERRPRGRWPELPEAIRAGIVAMVKAASESDHIRGKSDRV